MAIETKGPIALRNVVNDRVTMLGRYVSGGRRAVKIEDAQDQSATNPVDFAFLVTQTFGDAALERELLALFVDQTATILDALPALSYGQQSDLAHRLKGSARSIGAQAVAEAADAFEQAAAAARPDALHRLAAAAHAAQQAIAHRRAEAEAEPQ